MGNWEANSPGRVIVDVGSSSQGPSRKPRKVPLPKTTATVMCSRCSEPAAAQSNFLCRLDTREEGTEPCLREQCRGRATPSQIFSSHLVLGPIPSSSQRRHHIERFPVLHPQVNPSQQRFDLHSTSITSPALLKSPLQLYPPLVDVNDLRRTIPVPR